MPSSEKDLLLRRIQDLKLSLSQYEGVGAGMAWENYVLTFLVSSKVAKLEDLDVNKLTVLLEALEKIVSSYSKNSHLA